MQGIAPEFRLFPSWYHGDYPVPYVNGSLNRVKPWNLMIKEQKKHTAEVTLSRE